MRWYRQVTNAAEGDYSALADALDWFTEEHKILHPQLKAEGRIEKLAQRLPGMVEYNWRLLQEVEAIFKWAEIQETKILSKARKHYLENYPRALSERAANQMAEGDSTVIDIRLLLVEISLVRNYFLALTKGFEYLHYQLTNITRLRASGVEDATFE